MRITPDGKFYKCDKCGDTYVLIPGYNSEELCFWCSHEIPIAHKPKQEEVDEPV